MQCSALESARRDGDPLIHCRSRVPFIGLALWMVDISSPFSGADIPCEANVIHIFIGALAAALVRLMAGQQSALSEALGMVVGKAR